jgi:glutamate synthase (NADPH/NADH) small chain
MNKNRIPCREQSPETRVKNFGEVSLGYNEEEAVAEASRCLNCKKPLCVSKCPVSIDIPEFIAHVKSGRFEEAARVIARNSALPAICGRVCPQEIQCEGDCILGRKGEPIAIGKLERFVGDWAREHQLNLSETVEPNGHKVAVIGSGPSGLSCAGDLAKKGYSVKIFEALHKAGGVLQYGIHEFRLPKETVVEHEINNITNLGVAIEKDVIIGKTITIDQLLKEEGYSAVYVASGAGLPKFMNIPGENLNGVVSANEFLTRNNLMKAYEQGYDTPIFTGRSVVVVGGGNVAMDAARTARRLGAETSVVYRRSEEELPARKEEVHHAKEEGIIFKFLSNPVAINGTEQGWVKSIRCIQMELGSPDESGRRKPVIVPDSEFEIEADTVIMSLGTTPNPLISNTTPGIITNAHGCVVADEYGKSSRSGVFAGGDVVTGAATVILAMGAGKKAAEAIDLYIKKPKNSTNENEK